MPSPPVLAPDQWPLKRRCETIARLWTVQYAALQLTLLREKGEPALTDFKYRLLHRHQQAHFLAGLRKLGIARDLPPAVVAARYHYLSNQVGGLGMEYIEESPRKVWIRYLAPQWGFPGAGLFAVPARAARAVFAGWHAHNGVSLGAPRLGFVLTKLYQDGEPYDEGYFEEHDRDLAPDERIQYRPVISSPDFDPARAPRLDPVAWPEERRCRALRNFALGYVEDGVRTCLELFGVHAAAALLAQALRAYAIQYYHKLREAFEVADGRARGLVRLFAQLAELAGEEATYLEEGTTRIVLRRSPRLFAAGDVPPAIHRALFAFPEMCAKLHSARVRVTLTALRSEGAPQDEWVVEDVKDRLF
jgi:hypothetical protein